MEDNKNERIKIRESLCPSMGYLYPLHYQFLKEVENLEDMKDKLKGMNEYRNLLMNVPEPNRISESTSKTLEDLMYEQEVKLLCDTFDQQANTAVFYAYIKLKEQEIRNIVWYVEMIARNMEKTSSAWKKIIIPFNDDL